MKKAEAARMDSDETAKTSDRDLKEPSGGVSPEEKAQEPQHCEVHLDMANGSNGLAAYAESCLREKTVYLWGGMGQLLTRDYLKSVLNRYPNHFDSEETMELYALADGTTRAFDCSGLIKRFLMGGLSQFRYDPALDRDAATLCAQAEVSGEISSLPEVPGICLYMKDHVGIYVGNGEVIEATDYQRFGCGVVKTWLCNRRWEKWFCCKGIQYPAEVLQYHTPREKAVYLTFDDGPSDATEPILRLLKENDVKACFFVTHTSRPDLLKRICDEGHLLALHSYSHIYEEVYASPEAYFADLEKLEKLVWETAGVRPRCVRLPGGTNNTVHERYCKGIIPVIVQELDRRGYRIFDWNSGFEEDEHPDLSAREYLRTGCKYTRTRTSSIFLFHDRVKDERVLSALGGLIDYCQANRIPFRTPDQYENRHYLIDRSLLG